MRYLIGKNVTMLKTALSIWSQQINPWGNVITKICVGKLQNDYFLSVCFGYVITYWMVFSVSQPKKAVRRLGTDLLRMFLEEIGPDVIVEVDGHKLKAHKCILASRCQYFAALLSGNWLEKSGNVISLQVMFVSY